MGTATLVAGLVTALFAVVGPRLARRLPPAAATRVVVPGSAVVAVSGIWVLGAVAFTWVAQLGPVSRYGQWSARRWNLSFVSGASCRWRSPADPSK